MDVNQRKILVDEVQKIERNGVYDVRNALSARFIPEGILSLRATIIPSRFDTLVVPFIPGGRGVQVGRYPAHDPITVAEVSVHPES